MKTTVAILAALALVGCARFTTHQVDERNDAETKVATKATAVTFFASKSQLANFKASQTDKTQSATVGALSQEASAGTNVVSTVEALTKLLEALKR